MLYGWEIIAWAVNTASTWSSIVIGLFFMLIVVLLILWIGDNKGAFKRALIAAPIASLFLFGFHVLGQANIVLGSNSEILEKMRKNILYYDVVEIVRIKHRIFDPAILIVHRRGSNREEKVLLDTGGFGLGRIAFSSKPIRENSPDPETIYATETQDASDARRADRYKKIKPPIIQSAAVSNTTYEAIAFEPLLVEATKPDAKLATIVNKERILGVSTNNSNRLSE